MLAEPLLMYLSNYLIYITPFDNRQKVFRFIVLHESLTCVKTNMYGKLMYKFQCYSSSFGFLSLLYLFYFFLNMFPKRNAQSVYIY